MSKIYVTGDTHGYIDGNKLFTFSETHSELTKNDYLIILGDFGYIWDGSEDEKIDLNRINELPFTTLFLDGNHENFHLLNQYPQKTFHGGNVHQIADTIYHLRRGQVFDFDGTTIFTMGGARSTDRQWRVLNESWWTEELPTQEELDCGVQNLSQYDFKVDYILSHCTDTGTCLKISNYFQSDVLTDYFSMLKNQLHIDYQAHYFGHYHINKQLTLKEFCLYDSFKQIK